MIWEIRSATLGSYACEALLAEGWEPFSAYLNSDRRSHTIWFKRAKESERA